MKDNIRWKWFAFAGAFFVLYFMAVALADLNHLKPVQEKILGLLGAVLSGIVGAVIPGKAQLVGTMRWKKGIAFTLDASGGIALFVVVLFWWTGSSSPVPLNRDKGVSQWVRELFLEAPEKSTGISSENVPAALQNVDSNQNVDSGNGSQQTNLSDRNHSATNSSQEGLISTEPKEENTLSATGGSPETNPVASIVPVVVDTDKSVIGTKGSNETNISDKSPRGTNSLTDSTNQNDANTNRNPANRGPLLPPSNMTVTIPP